MSKLMKTLLAVVAAAALAGSAYAADTDKGRDSGTGVENQTQGAPVEETAVDANAEGRNPNPDPSQDTAGGAVEQENKDAMAEGRDLKKEDYQAELQKCDSMTGTQKQTCIDTAKKKHGQM